MFSQQIECVRKQLEAIQRAAAVPGIKGSVGRCSRKLEDRFDHRLRARHIDLGVTARVPGHGDVEIIEQPVARHVDFATDRFFGRRAVETNRPGQFSGFDQLPNRVRRGQARNTV